MLFWTIRLLTAFHPRQVVPLLWSEALVIALEEVEAMRKDIPCRIETCRAEVLDAVSQLRKTTTLLSEERQPLSHCGEAIYGKHREE